MARAETTTDAFNAVAEPQRRRILDLLAGGERSVTELVDGLRLTQPQGSKHLRVLREGDAAHVRDDGGGSTASTDRPSSPSTTGSRPTSGRGRSASTRWTRCWPNSNDRRAMMAA